MTTLRTRRLAIAAAFLTQGLLFISLTTRLPRFQDRWGLDELAVSGLLLLVVLLAGVGSVVAELVAGRRDSATALRLGLLLVAAGMALLTLAPVVAGFVAGLAVYGVGLGAVDAAGNMQAVTLEHRYARPILPSFHGAWTAGGVVATLVAIAVAHLDLGVGLAPLALLALLAAAAPLLPGTRDPVAAPTDAERADAGMPWRRVALLGVALVLFYMVDTAATTWGPIFLREAFASPDRIVPLATLPYLVAALVARLSGDRLAARLGPAVLVRVGGVVAAVSLVVIVASPTWVVAVVGFTVLGASVAVVAPLSFSAAAALGREGSHDEATRRARTDAVVARFNQFNYVGALLGAVLTGVFGAGTLRVGFAVPAVLILAIVPLARQFVRPTAVAAPARD